MHINREELKKKNQETQEYETLSGEVSSTSVPSKNISKNCSDVNNRNSVLTPEKKEKKAVRKKLPAKYIWLIVLLAVILVATCFKIYLNNSYKPQNQGVEIDDSSLNIDLTDNMLVVRNPELGQTKHKIGIIFYQANRVEGACYLPLMKKLALKGYDCFLPVAFGNQAYLNVEGAESVIRKYDTIKTWAIVGHSVSCSIVSDYVHANPDKIQGIVFLGGYSKIDLSSSNIPVLSLLGSEDSIVDINAYEKAKINLPSNTEYKVIEGGNNSCYVDTSLILGDSRASISFDEQTDISANYIHEFLQDQLEN